MDHFTEETVEKASRLSKGVKLGVGIAVLLSVTAGVSYLYGNYVKEKRYYERTGRYPGEEDDGQAQITEEEYEENNYGGGNNEEMEKQILKLKEKIDKLDDETRMAVIQLGSMIEEQAYTGRIDHNCIAGIDNLVYDLGEKELLLNNENYKNMRRSIYEEILTNFSKSNLFLIT